MKIKGLPFIPPRVEVNDDHYFSRREQLTNTITAIIFICSVGHSITHARQYEEYAYPMNYPAVLHGEPPRDKVKELKILKSDDAWQNLE